MSGTKKSLLIAGLGTNADPTKFQIDKVEEVLAIEMKKLADAGFDSKHITLDPKNVSDSMQRLDTIIAGRNWDFFSIGFAVRGLNESTGVFEKAVNVWVEKCQYAWPLGIRNDIDLLFRVRGLGNEATVLAIILTSYDNDCSGANSIET